MFETFAFFLFALVLQHFTVIRGTEREREKEGKGEKEREKKNEHPLKIGPIYVVLEH